MVFSNTSDKSGILQDCESILFADNYGAITGNSGLLATFTRNANRALDRATSLIFNADGRWQYDDKNNSDYSIATTDITAGQDDYPLDVTHLKISYVQVENTRLTPLDRGDYDRPLSEIFGSGTPKYYDLFNDSIFIYPNPDTDITGGLKLYFQRGASYFLSTDTTKSPGFDSIFHRLISLWASYDYASAKFLPVARVLRDEIAIMEQELKDHYSLKSKDEHIKLVPRYQSYR